MAVRIQRHQRVAEAALRAGLIRYTALPARPLCHGGGLKATTDCFVQIHGCQ